MSMKAMPGHLASLGGCRDRTDRDSRETALREVKEECGLGKCVSNGPWKFAEGEKCDWFVMVLRKPTFEAKAKSRSECGDIKSVVSLLPSSMQVAECYGHAWVPTSDLAKIDPKLPLMGGLVNRVNQAVKHLNSGAAPEKELPVDGGDGAGAHDCTECSSEQLKVTEETLSAVQSSDPPEVIQET
eukprot:Skav230423  [mRNA]  locus=scaffold1601:18014:18568:- [translate_table: standard]